MTSYDEALLDQKRTENQISSIAAMTQAAGTEHYTLEDLEARLELLEGYWRAYVDKDFALQRAADALAGRTYFKAKTFATAQGLYLTAKAWFRKQIRARSAAIVNQSQTNTAARGTSANALPTQAALEKIKLPHFDGKQRDWEVFKEKFTSLVINDTNMDPIIKLQHLTNCLEGEAAGKLKGIQLIGANLQTAWDTLCSRYDNKYLRFTYQMQSLMKLPLAATESEQHLSRLLNTVNESINVFGALERPVEHWDDILVFCVDSKLAPSTRLEWKKQVEKQNKTGFPKYADIKVFLEERIRTLDLVEPAEADSPVGTSAEADFCADTKKDTTSQTRAKGGKNTASANQSRRVTTHVATEKSANGSKHTPCSFCRGDHFVGYCKKFNTAPIEDRRAHASSASLCFNCLSTSHQVNQCHSKGRCLVCRGKHHTKLHTEGSTTAAVATTENPAALPATDTIMLTGTAGSPILLSTACVLLQAADGQTVTARVLLDSGAEESFISEHMVQLLSLRKHVTHVAVSGVGGSTAAVAKSRVTATLKSNYDANFAFELSALVLQKLTSIIPHAAVSVQDRSYLRDVTLADPHFDKPATIDCVLSSAVYAAVLRPGIRRGTSTQPTALNTVFGWVLLGPAAAACHEKSSNVSLFHTTVDEELTSAIARFWEVEEPPSRTHIAPEEETCYDYFRQTTTRNTEGRFVVRIPFVTRPELSNTRPPAEACLRRIERRLAMQPELASSYRAFMAEYEELRHMEVVSGNQGTNPTAIYLPHHPVVKKDGSNKLRVVFNASQKNAAGLSLNSFMHIGPKLQEDVLSIIIRWSFLPVVFTCDIVKMFRQFLVHPDDRDCQRIVWRSSTDKSISAFRLTTVTYGTASAPFLANACLLQLADDEQRQFPEAAEALRKNRYADDFFVGGDSIEEALIMRNQLTQILQTAGMAVGKWAANRPELLQNLDDCEVQRKGVAVQEHEVVSTLGLHWLATEDAFCFYVSELDATETVTKRSILSEIAKLYDPIGWLSPVVVTAKIVMQNLWLQGANWDDPVPAVLKTTWIDFRDQLKELKSLRIPRWNGASKSSSWQLHGFCDASERAYAAALYMVLATGDDYSVRLITAKSKVAPIKVISLPKLELCGAALLTKLICCILPKLDRQPLKIHCWSDSKVVLAWLHAHPSRWKSFIANRVSDIVTSLPTAVWDHVASGDNPADLATRGLLPRQLREANLWWNGPCWLSQPSSQWPISTQQDLSTEEEARKKSVSSGYVAQADEYSEWISAFSSVDKLVRILAYVHRWRSNAKLPRVDRRLIWLSASELAQGYIFLLRLVQATTFSQEIHQLQRQAPIPNSSSIRRLSPFLDRDGLLRVGGRLQNAFLSNDEKHPIILSSQHYLVTLLIRQAHIVTLHGGPTVVHSHLLRQFWILRGRNTIRKIVRECVRCARYRATTLEQQMGPLPEVRVRPARPFTYTGIDFAGPFLMRCSAGRGQKAFKGYVAVFVCMVVRAVHIEVVSDLTSAAFLAAFRRFTARRGLCKIVYSDNATNFQGAQSELRRLFSQTSAISQEIAASIAKDGVEWSYIPPRAPNFGGLWEAGVKSFKGHLRRIIGETKLTFEEFYTVASMIEACLNSRPLSSLHSNEEDVSPLTPGHFLIGAPLTAPPEPFIETNENQSPSSRWHLLTLMRNHFWKRWSRECLAQLQQRSKWLHPNHTFQEGDVVLYKDALMSPTKWPLARISRLYKGKDGLCRVALIKTESAEFKRAINKLILLPVNKGAATHLATLSITV